MTTIGENFRDKVDRLVAEYIEELKEENKTLKDKIEFLTNCLDDRDKSIELLKSDLAFKNTMLDNVKAEYENLQEINKNLNERIRFLEQCLDNKEKVNKSLREENNKLKDELQEWLNAVGNHR